MADQKPRSRLPSFDQTVANPLRVSPSQENRSDVQIKTYPAAENTQGSQRARVRSESSSDGDGWIESHLSPDGTPLTPKAETFDPLKSTRRQHFPIPTRTPPLSARSRSQSQSSESAMGAQLERALEQVQKSADGRTSRALSVGNNERVVDSSKGRIVIPPPPTHQPPPLPRIPPQLEKELLIGLVDRIERMYDEEKKKRETSDSMCEQLRQEVEVIRRRESLYATQLAQSVRLDETSPLDQIAEEEQLFATKYQELLDFDADAMESIKLIQRWYRKTRLGQKLREINVIREALKKSVQRTKVDIIKDIVELERNYVRNLTMIFQFFLSPLKSACKTSDEILKENEIDSIFAHIDLFLKFHRRQLIEMENLLEADANAPLDETFLDFTRLLPEYYTYTENYPKSMQTLRACEKRSEFTEFLKKTNENPYCGRFPLAILLYFPISYAAKIYEYLKAVKDTIVDVQLPPKLDETLTIFTDYMNESQEDRAVAENLQKIITIQQKIFDYQADDTFFERAFIREGLLNKIYEKNEDFRPFRYFFLFSDSLIIASLINHPKSPFKVVHEIKLSEILVEIHPDTARVKNIFSIITNANSTPERFFTSSLNEREEWIKAIKVTIAKLMKKTTSTPEKAEAQSTKKSFLLGGLRRLKDEIDVFKVCAQGNVQSLVSLVQQGHNLERANNVGDRPIHIAAAANDDRIISILLENRVNINARNQNGETPLHVAALGNHVRATCLLLEKGADPKITDNDGRVPADLATLATLKRVIEDYASGKNKRHSIVSNLSANAISSESIDKMHKFGSVGRERNRQTASFFQLMDIFNEDTSVQLLSGESIAIKVDEVVDIIESTASRPARMLITNYRLVLYSSSKGESPSGFQYDIPLNTIDSVDKASLQGSSSMGLEIRCKDFRNIRVGFAQTSQNRKRVQKTLCDNCSPFAFFHTISNTTVDGWSVYTIESDFARMNVPDPEWKITDMNSEFRLCSTYNKWIAVPTIMLDSELKAVASFRSRARIPALCWRKPSTGATLSRCSQPRAGITGYRCPEDEKLLKAISALNKRSNLLYIIDCRPRVNAVANQAKGAGFENTGNYTNCEVIFMDIENIHVVRDSWKKLQDLVYGIGQGDDGRWYSILEGTQWLVHIQSIIRAAKFIVEQMNLKECSFLVHCSDGWDRTSQVVALSELLLDPHYRTIHGFEALIEKEWLSFGHKFATRCGHGPPNCDSDQRSPVFLQFLECVWQITRQYPTAFEFNESFLITIMDHVYNCRFATFLCDSVSERHQLLLYTKPSLWTWMNHDLGAYKNALYAKVEGSLTPSDGMWNLRLWTNMYLRYSGIQPLVQ